MLKSTNQIAIKFVTACVLLGCTTFTPIVITVSAMRARSVGGVACDGRKSMHVYVCTYRMFGGECARLRENVPYVNL